MNKHYLWVKTKCLDYYKFINKVAKLNIKIYDIEYQNKVIYLKIEQESLAKLEKYLVSYKFKIVRELGIYKVIEKIKEYHIFIICFCLGFMLLVMISNLIVDVNVIHENKEIRGLLLDELEEAGVKKLAFKKSYQEMQRIKENILAKYPDKLDWIEFEVEGMVINVRVEERIITDISKSNKKCNIVAVKEGTISNLKVREGEAVVRANDLVKEGDILISGIITHNNEEKTRVCASGEVYAHTWYTVKVSIPLVYEKSIATGRKKYNLVWQNKDNKTKIFKDRFTSYDAKYKTLFKAFDFKLLLESDYETKKSRQEYSEDEALKVGIAKATESLKKKLGAKNSIIDKKVLKKSLNDSKMDIEIFIVANELISREQEIMDATIEGNDSSDIRNNQSNNQ